MTTYFIVFSIIGAILGALVPDKKSALLIIVGISVVWGVTHKPIWGLVTLGELFLGYFVVFALGAKK